MWVGEKRGERGRVKEKDVSYMEKGNRVTVKRVLGVDTHRCTQTQVSVVLSQGQETQANTSGVK